MEKRLDLTKSSNWDIKVLIIILGNVDGITLGLMSEHSWDIYMDPLMVLSMASLRAYFLETHWDLLVVKCLDLMKSSNWYYLVVK